MVVDSCIDRLTRRPVALDYLDELGVDVAQAVKLVVATHWHDDHFEGAARVLRVAESAWFSCSACLRSSEFSRLVAGAKTTLMESPGTSEFLEIFGILEERTQRGARAGSVTPLLAKSNVCLLRRHGVEVHALSPSDGAMRLSWHEIAQSLPEVGQPKRRAVALSPNQVGVVLWVIAGDVRILLGGDLEESVSPTLGWRAIVGSSSRPGGRAQIFKVPHHGSQDADSPDVWEQMLRPEPHALLTPFATGGRFLPTQDDIARLLARTPNLYCTAKSGGWSPPRRSNVVEKMSKRIARNRRVIRGDMGHVRVLGRLSDSPLQVHCCRGAYRATL